MAGLHLPRSYPEVALYFLLGWVGLIAVSVFGVDIVFGFLVAFVLWGEAVVGGILLFQEQRK